MEKDTYRFDLPTRYQSIIKVIGVGGGGSNAVNNMYNRGIKDVSFVVCNTDAQALESSPIACKLQLGMHLTGGLGAGANPEVGKNAALESKEDIKKLLSDTTKMLFITAGMGGGTGTGAAPVIASIARKLGVLTVGIVTLPFSFEGKKKLQQAQEGIEQLRQHCDTVLIILNDRLRSVLGNLSIGNAFAQADNVLTTAAKSIAEIITVPGYVNVDFEDVKTVMSNAGAAVMGSGQAEGKERALKAAEAALASPLLSYKDIHGAKKILLSIVSGKEAELQMDELTVITDYIQNQVGTDAEMIFGHGADPQLEEHIRVTVIATGFEKEHETVAHSVQSSSDQQTYLFSGSDRQLTDRPYFASPPNAASAHTKTHQPSTSAQANASQVLDALAQKKTHLHQKSQARIHAMGNKPEGTLSEEQIKEWLKVPAFLRKNIQLQPPATAPEQEIIRYPIEGDTILDQQKDEVD
ncbi:MAG: cell division protein FtsZ [Bacteroidota bacterium]